MSVSDLVKKYVPSSWQPNDSSAALTGAVYSVYDVARNSPEFNIVTKQCVSDGLRVTRVQRMQNIYMFGRYLLRHQQLLCRRPGRNIESQRYVCISSDKIDILGRNIESRRYVCISSDKIDILGTYNVDHRRLDLPPEAFNLYSTPREALNRSDVSNPLMVICRVSREDHVTTFDCEIYPEYLAWVSDC